MNYAKIMKADIANGFGFRVSLFVSGCARNCRGCFNEVAQNPAYGKKFDESAKAKIFNELDKDWCRGLSILGGEPLSYLSDNRAETIRLCREAKERHPHKDIWMWSGYTLEEIESMDDCREILDYIDILVDGPFIEELKDVSLKWRGSSNQRIFQLTRLGAKQMIFDK